jgi:hypothetical protein
LSTITVIRPANIKSEGFTPWKFDATVFLTSYPSTDDLDCDPDAKEIPIWTVNGDITCSTLKDVREKVTVLQRKSIPLSIDSTRNKSTIHTFFLPQDDGISLCLLAAADGQEIDLSNDKITLQLRDGKYQVSVALEDYFKDHGMVIEFCPLNTMPDVKGHWDEEAEEAETEETEVEVEAGEAESEAGAEAEAAAAKQIAQMLVSAAQKRRGKALNGRGRKKKPRRY